MKLGVVVDVHSWEVEPPEDSDEPYRYRGFTDGDVSDVKVFANSDGARGYWTEPFDLDVNIGDTVYPVVVVYGTGDTFGRQGGQTEVMDIFDNEGDASEFISWLGKVERNDLRKGIYTFDREFNGKKYHIPWFGYFEWLENIAYYECEVEKR